MKEAHLNLVNGACAGGCDGDVVAGRKLESLRFHNLYPEVSRCPNPDWNYQYNVEGTSAFPSLIIRVLPDGTEWYEQYVVDQWGNRTNVISTYTSGSSVLTRTNTYLYAANGVDLLFVIGPDGVTNAAYGYDGNHEVLSLTNALGEITGFTYNGNRQLTSISYPSGLITTNKYNSQGFLSIRYDYAVISGTTVYYRSNYFTYANGLVYTRTDERGLSVTNTWDNLQRVTQQAFPNGTVSYTYTNLDLVKVVDRMNFTNSYKYDAIRRKIAQTDPLGRTTFYGYCPCGGMAYITNALNQVTQFVYDNQGNLVTTLYPDGYAVTNRYNSVQQMFQTTDTGGRTATNWFNNQGLLVGVSNAFGCVQRKIFDIDDRATNTVDPNSISINITYDKLNRPLTRVYPDTGVESFGYTPKVFGMTSYTNQVNNVLLYAYDPARRKTNEVYLGVTTNGFGYNGSADLLTLTDGRNQTTTWKYDQYGQVTNKLDALGTNAFGYQYDPDGRLTNRTSAAKGSTAYRYDPVANLTNVSYPVNTNLNLAYDSLNRLTNMVDGVGTTVYSYDAAGQLLSEDGPWVDDTVSYTYNSRLRSGLSLLAPNASEWTETYGYDGARRLTTLSSPAGAFTYAYDSTRHLQVSTLTLPTGAYISDAYDSVARLLSTKLLNSSAVVLNSHVYGYNAAGQRLWQTNTAGDYRGYTYDNRGQLKTAVGHEPGGSTARLQEQLGYAYDPAGNLNWRTNNGFWESFQANAANELTTVSRSTTNLTVAGTTSGQATNVTINSVDAALYGDYTFAQSGFSLANGNNTFTAIGKDNLGRKDTNSITVNLPASANYTYDANGNFTSDGTRYFAYDDENQLVSVWVTNSWRSDFVYDGRMRRRIRREYVWQSAVWNLQSEVHYVYDGNLAIQERDANNLPLVSYTRGRDLGGSLQGAGGIRGLLARTDHRLLTIGDLSATAYYAADGGGNMTALINAKQVFVAKYLYDPFGNILSQSGPLADANLYRFSSKEFHVSSGLAYFLYRFYDANTQRWPNRDPLGERVSYNLYALLANDPVNHVDAFGLLGPGNPVSGPGGPVGGPEPPVSPPIIVPPYYNPGFWNGTMGNNCYNYALDQPTGGFRQPCGGFPPGALEDCQSLKNKVFADGGNVPDSSGNCAAGTHKIRLWANGLPSGAGGDFHFYRQDCDGSWSDKPGPNPVGQVPNPGGYSGSSGAYQNCGDLCVANQPLRF